MMKTIYYTARQMAEMSHNLSRDGMTARLPNGDIFAWSNHFNIWAGPFNFMHCDAKKPRAKKRAA